MLFNDTLRHNVAYSRPSATFEELEKAAKAAKLDAVVARLSKGWESLVGERGLKLSGGEKQRVAIARAFLRQGAWKGARVLVHRRHDIGCNG